MSTTLFRASGATMKGHDRYLIYRMLNRKVSFQNVNRKPYRMITGTVKSVRRDIFANEIELVVENRVFRFKEPQAIILKEGKESAVVFLYGLDDKEPTDAALFKETRSRHYKGETIHDAMKRLAPQTRKEVVFVLGEKQKCRFRSKDK